MMLQTFFTPFASSTEAPPNLNTFTSPTLAAGGGGAQHSAAKLPQPTPEQIVQMKKIMSDPRQLALINQSMQTNPDYANLAANNPIMQELNRELGSLSEQDMKMMTLSWDTTS